MTTRRKFLALFGVAPAVPLVLKAETAAPMLVGSQGPQVVSIGYALSARGITDAGLREISEAVARWPA